VPYSYLTGPYFFWTTQITKQAHRTSSPNKLVRYRAHDIASSSSSSSSSRARQQQQQPGKEAAAAAGLGGAAATAGSLVMKAHREEMDTRALALGGCHLATTSNNQQSTMNWRPQWE